MPANRGGAPLGSTMGSAEGGAAPKDGERGWESTAAAGAAAAEAKPADTPTAEATAAIQKMISVLDAAKGARERLRAAHARAAETCASQLGFDAVLVEPREIVPDAAASGACGCRLACRLAC